MSQKWALEEGGKKQCETCSGHSAMMSMMALAVLAVIGGLAVTFLK
jgi:hypothetical protein